MGRPSKKQLGCQSYKCQNEHFSGGYCRTHYPIYFYQNKGMCEIEGCNHPKRYKTMCAMHYMRQYRAVGGEMQHG